MSREQSRRRSRSRALSASGPMPGGFDVARSDARSPLVIDMPARARSRSVGRNGPLVDAPGLSGGRGMFKRLIVACDGTWNNADDGMKNGMLQIPSNITRISRAIKTISQDGIPQIVCYHQGLGTEGGTVSRFVSGTIGKWLGDDVRETYSFLANNYHPGDEIFLLGFSRGAFTARCVGGLIAEIGLLTKKALNSLPDVYEDVTHRSDPNYVSKQPDIPFPRKPSADDPRYARELERRGLTRLDIPIKAIGVWDTVGALGIPRIGLLQRVGLQTNQSKHTSFHDTKLSNCVENAFQALALDETRASFSPSVWEKPEGNQTTLRQVWFPGVHSNIGGGYDDQELSNITLAWMMSQLEPFLDMRGEYLFEQEEMNEKYQRKEEGGIRPWGFGRIYNELKGIFLLGGARVRSPGHYMAIDPESHRDTERPLRQTNEYIHPSVRMRIRGHGPGVLDKGVYECPALTEAYKLVVDYGPGNQQTGDPEIYWKIRRSEGLAVRELPEAPLWRLERELARRDRKTYGLITRPPATDSSKKKRRNDELARSRPPSGAVGGGGRDPRDRDARKSRREPFSPRQTFTVEERAGRRSSAVLSEKQSRIRSRSRAQSMEYDRETDIREEMPHRREKDKAWWEGQR